MWQRVRGVDHDQALGPVPPVRVCEHTQHATTDSQLRLHADYELTRRQFDSSIAYAPKEST